MLIEEDQVPGSNFQITPEGITQIRAFRITDITPTPGSNIHERVMLSTDANGRRIPRYGSPHPTIRDFIVTFIEFFPMADSPYGLRCVCHYTDSLAVKVRVNGHVVPETTKLNNGGKLLRVRYKYGQSKGAPMPVESDTNAKTETAEVQVFRPVTVIQFERWVTKHPYKNQETFLGAVNKSKFLGQPENCWLCTTYDITEVPIYANRGPWREVIAFERRMRKGTGNLKNRIIDDHRPLLVFRDPNTAITPPDVDLAAGGFPNTSSGNGWLREEVYPQADMKELDLPDVYVEN